MPVCLNRGGLMDTMYTELSLAAAGLVLGILLMAAYDVLRMFRFFVSHTPLWTGLEDVVYWLCSGISCFALLSVKNGGEVRTYIIASVLIGMIFWDKTFSRILSALLKKMKKYLRMKKR